MSSKITITKPTKPFFSLSVSQQRHVVGEVKKAINTISNGDYTQFFNHFCTKTNLGKDYILPATQNIKLTPIVKNIQILYQNSKSDIKLSLLSLIANQYQYKELLSFSFELSQAQFTRAKILNNNQTQPQAATHASTPTPTPTSTSTSTSAFTSTFTSFSASTSTSTFIPTPAPTHFSASTFIPTMEKTSYKNEMVKNKRSIIILFLLTKAKESAILRATPSLNPSNYDVEDYNPYMVYHLNLTITELYYQFAATELIKKISKSSFFYISQITLKRGKKMTDMCKVCLALPQLKK